MSAPPLQEAPEATQGAAEPVWPERRGQLQGVPPAIGLALPGFVAQVLARWGHAPGQLQGSPLRFTSAKAPQRTVPRLYPASEPAPGQPQGLPLLREVLSRHGLPPQPPGAPLPSGRGTEGEGRRVIRLPSPVPRQPSARSTYRLPQRVTDRPMALSRQGKSPEAPPPYMHRLTALAEAASARHGAMPGPTAWRQPSEPPGRVPPVLRKGLVRPTTEEREALFRPPSFGRLAPQPTSEPPATAPQPETIAGEPVGAQPLPAHAMQPVAEPGARAEEAQAPPQKKPVFSKKTSFSPAQPPRRFGGPPAPLFEARPGQERPAQRGHQAASLSRQALSRPTITTLALTRPALILRLRHYALSAEALLPPRRLATLPDDILTRYGLSPEPRLFPASGAQLRVDDRQGTTDRDSPSPVPRPPSAEVRRIPRWRHRGPGRLAAEALERTLGVAPGEPMAFPITPGEGRHPQPAFSLPSFLTTEGEKEGEIAFPSLGPSLERLEGEMEEAGGIARPSGPLRELRRRLPRRAMPTGAIVPEVLSRAVGWLTSHAGATLAFLEAVWPAREPPPGIKETGEAAPAQREWPALGLLRRLARPATSGEPAALQVLRRMSPAQLRPALAALRSLPTLGSGEALPLSVRRPMETLLGRNLSAVRLYTAPAAAALGAEAFTSGERVVFAPGRLDVRSRQGLALIGHELAHIGQPLAFKQSPGAGPAVVDEEEGEARRQEAIVRRIAEGGWPVGPRMEVRRRVWTSDKGTTDDRRQSSIAPRPSSVLDRATGLRFERVAIEPGPARPVIQRARADGRASVGPFSESATAPLTAVADQPSGPDLDALARQVYSLLKARLRAERDRHQLYSR